MPSLNTIRVFDAVARHGGVSKAAEELLVTPSAVSHQLAQLERDLGISLLERSANRVALTVEGARFAQRIAPGLATIRSAVRETGRDANVVSLKSSVSIAVRLLIPRLQRFREEHPAIQVQVESSHLSALELTPSLDIVLTYRRGAPDSDSVLPDRVLPMASPALIARYGNGPLDGPLGGLPALRASEENWDWRAWAAHRGAAIGDVRFGDRFDIDDAAILAAAAGLGVCLVPVALARREIDLGLLEALPGESPVTVGHYALLVNDLASASSRKLANWLRAEFATLADLDAAPNARNSSEC
ncbi:MAG: LysR family transcriptional regulator [Alphaproteobacteria bacterium]|nr:LysR family transcriptional regulator [Alphaproteobacteria bacterium]